MQDKFWFLRNSAFLAPLGFLGPTKSFTFYLIFAFRYPFNWVPLKYYNAGDIILNVMPPNKGVAN